MIAKSITGLSGYRLTSTGHLLVWGIALVPSCIIAGTNIVKYLFCKDRTKGSNQIAAWPIICTTGLPWLVIVFSFVIGFQTWYYPRYLGQRYVISSFQDVWGAMGLAIICWILILHQNIQLNNILLYQ